MSDIFSFCKWLRDLANSDTRNDTVWGDAAWDGLTEAADTIEIMAREIADLKAQHLLTQAEEIHRIIEEAETQ